MRMRQSYGFQAQAQQIRHQKQKKEANQLAQPPVSMCFVYQIDIDGDSCSRTLFGAMEGPSIFAIAT